MGRKGFLLTVILMMVCVLAYARSKTDVAVITEYIQGVSETGASASCIGWDTDRPYADLDCSDSKGGGEQYLDETGFSGDYVQSVADGTGIDGTATGSASTYTPTLDLTEINSATFGNGTFTTLAFDAGVSDPTITFGSNLIDFSSGIVNMHAGTKFTDTDMTVTINRTSNLFGRQANVLLTNGGTTMFYFGASALHTGSNAFWTIDDGVNILFDLQDVGTTANATVSGDLTISGDDLFMATNTDRFVLMGDGTNYNPEAIDLGTDTVGGYAASTTEGGGATSLEADGLDALTEIAQGIKTAANDTSALVVGTAGSNGELAKWNTDGTLTDANVVIGTVTDGKWCSYASSGTVLSCTQDAPAGSGDITSVGNVASGAAFDGTQGTLLTFFDVVNGNSTIGLDGGGNFTITPVGSLLFRVVESTIEFSSTLPEILFTDTTASQDDFRITMNASAFTIKNETDNVNYFNASSTHALVLGSSSVPSLTVTTDGTGTGEVVLPSQSISGSEIVSGDVSTTQLGTDSVSADELDATGVESELESTLDIGGEVTSTGMGSTVIADSITVASWTLTSATVSVADDVDFTLGTDGDWKLNYDESVDNQLLVTTTNTSAIATTDPMFEILADFGTANGTGMTADQQVFGVAKGTQASNVSLFTVDEDGDGLFNGTADATGGFTINATTESSIESAIDTLANLTSVQSRTVTLADAGANAFFGWDDTAGAYENLTDAEAEAIMEPLIDTLANLTSASSLATVGTITSGTWNAGAVTSSGTVTGTLIQVDSASTGVSLDTDGDGMIILTGTSAGNDEDLRINLDDGIGGANSIEITSGSAATDIDTALNIRLEENTSVRLDPAGSADGKYSGLTVTGTGGATIAFGDIVTLDKDDSRWELVDISVAAAATGDARGIMGVAVTSSTDGGAITVLLQGIVRADANFPALTIGASVYASTTGDIVVAQPTTVDYVIRILGFAMTADEIYFSPSTDYITHT